MDKRSKMKDRLSLLVVRSLPKRIVYWAFIHVVSSVTSGKYSNTIVPELTAVDALTRFGKDNLI